MYFFNSIEQVLIADGSFTWDKSKLEKLEDDLILNRQSDSAHGRRGSRKNTLTSNSSDNLVEDSPGPSIRHSPDQMDDQQFNIINHVSFHVNKGQVCFSN